MKECIYYRHAQPTHTLQERKKEINEGRERQRKDKGYLLPAFEKPSSMFITLSVKPADTLLRVNKY